MTTTSRDIRVLTTAEDVAAAAAAFRTAMIGLPLPPPGDVTAVTEPGRTLGAFAGGQLIGGADSYTSWLTVPGGARVPHAAVTHVGVLPTHTRQGALTALLRAQLADIAARGEVVASLRASEAVIYERFGYGVASWAADYELDRRRGRLRDTVRGADGAPRTVRLVDAATAVKLLSEVYRVAAWTGSIDRPAYWWNQRKEWAAPSTASTGSGPRYVAVHGAEGAEDGYLSYHPVDTAGWFGGSNRTVVVGDLVAHTADAYLGGTRFGALAAAGRVTEHLPGAVALADALFGTERAPFAGTGF